MCGGATLYTLIHYKDINMNSMNTTQRLARRQVEAKDGAVDKVLVKRGTRIVAPYSEKALRYFGEGNFLVMTVAEAQDAGYLSGKTRRDLNPALAEPATPVARPISPRESIATPPIVLTDEEEADKDFEDSVETGSYEEDKLDAVIKQQQEDVIEANEGLINETMPAPAAQVSTDKESGNLTFDDFESA